MKFPLIKNENEDVINPCNVMLHNNEGHMIFSDDKDTSQLFSFDMEHGKIIE